MRRSRRGKRRRAIREFAVHQACLNWSELEDRMMMIGVESMDADSLLYLYISAVYNMYGKGEREENGIYIISAEHPQPRVGERDKTHSQNQRSQQRHRRKNRTTRLRSSTVSRSLLPWLTDSSEGIITSLLPARVIRILISSLHPCWWQSWRWLPSWWLRDDEPNLEPHPPEIRKREKERCW